MAQAGDKTLRDTAGAEGPEFPCTETVEGIKTQGFLSSGSLLRGTQVELLFVTVP